MRTGRAYARAPRRSAGTPRGSDRPPWQQSSGVPARDRRRRRSTGRLPQPAVELVFLLAHRRLPLGEGVGDEPGQIHHAAPRLTSEVGRRDLRGLFSDEPRRQDRARGPGPQAKRDPEQPPHAESFLPLLPPLPPNRLVALRTPTPIETSLTRGPETASSTSPEIRRTRPTISPVASSTTSTRSSSRFVRSRDPFTSRSSGTVSSRITSIRIFVLSRTRNVLMRTTHRNRTSSPQNADSTMSATSPPSSAAIIPTSPPSSPSLSRLPGRRVAGHRPGSGSAHHTGGASSDVPPSVSDTPRSGGGSVSSPSPDGS